MAPLEQASTDGELEKAAVRWLRMDQETEFDIYADVAADPPHDPVMGVFAPAVNAPHVADLYSKSSARYLFEAWLRAGAP